MRRRMIVAIAIVGALAGLPGCADDSAGPRVAPPPDPAVTAEGAHEGPGRGPRPRVEGALTAKPGLQVGEMKTESK